MVDENDQQMQAKKNDAILRLNNLSNEQLGSLINYLHNVINIR